MTTRAVVLAGGGVAGIAWLLGVITALRDGGIDLADADTVLGTSAGSVVAAQLATGVIDVAARSQQLSDTAERCVEFDFEEFQQLAADAAANATTPEEVARRMAQLPLQQTDIGAEQRRAIVAARLPVDSWPDRDLTVCAVERDTGLRATFQRSDGVPLVDAVAASCAVPGVWPPVAIGGRHYVDGGAWSLSNADLVDDSERVLVLVPVVASDAITSTLDRELGQRKQGASFILSADDDAGAAFGPNPLDPATRPAAFAAGRRQGAASAPDVALFWRG